jgi:hypothetical protein
MSKDIIKEDMPVYLKDVLMTVSPRVTEDDFRTKYLPLLFSSNPKDFTMRWVNEVARTMHSRVIVVDNLTNDNLLFTVPPLFDMVDNTKESIGLELSSVQQEMKRMPVYGLQLFKAALLNGIDISAEVNPEYEVEWRAILRRYDKEHLLSVTEEEYQPELNDVDDNSFFNYGELD